MPRPRFEKTFEDQRNIFLVYEKSLGGEFFQTVFLPIAVSSPLTRLMATFDQHTSFEMRCVCRTSHFDKKCLKGDFEKTGSEVTLRPRKAKQSERKAPRRCQPLPAGRGVTCAVLSEEFVNVCRIASNVIHIDASFRYQHYETMTISDGICS